MEHPITKVDTTYKIDTLPDSRPVFDDSPSTQAPEKVFPNNQEWV